MIETIGQSITFYAFFTAAGQGKTGLSVAVDVYRGTSVVTTGATAEEVAGGLYRFAVGGENTTAAEAYAAVFRTDDASVDAQHVPSLWVVGPTWAESAAKAGADQVWDEALAGHATAGTAGAALAATSAFGSGDGDTPVDHDTGGADHLRYTSNGIGVDDATVRAYLKADYDAGAYVQRGRTFTRADGRWARPMYLDAGQTYTITFSKPGVYQVSTRDVTV